MKPLTIIAVFFTTALAAQITIHNDCPIPIFIKPDGPGSTGTIQAIPTDAVWIQPLAGVGNALKFASSPEGLNKPVQFDYSESSDGNTYYDVTNSPGSPFPLEAVADGCATVVCPGNENDCMNVKACKADASVHVTACP